MSEHELYQTVLRVAVKHGRVWTERTYTAQHDAMRVWRDNLDRHGRADASVTLELVRVLRPSFVNPEPS